MGITNRVVSSLVHDSTQVSIKKDKSLSSSFISSEKIVPIFEHVRVFKFL